MKIIENDYIPVGDFDVMNILGLLFVRKGTKLTDTIIRHEAIHTVQQYEILCTSALVALIASNIYASWWYLLMAIAMPIAVYVLAWLVELALPPYDTAYRDSPFEREAYMNQDDPMYLPKRPLFAWIQYILRKKDRK